MKFSLVLLSWFIQLPLCARPVRFEHEIIEDGEKPKDTGAKDSWCDTKFAKKTLDGRCKQPDDQTNRDFIWTDDGYIYDTHSYCNVTCCDTGAGIEGTRCKCTPYLRKYNGYDWKPGVHRAQTSHKCCGRKQNGVAATLSGGRCGCTAIGEMGAFGTDPAHDCCSKAHKNGICVRGVCAKKGTKGHCCRLKGDDEPRKEKTSCPCFHSGEVPSPNDVVDWGNCCSGKEDDDTGGMCGCIKDGKTSLSDGADERDCCTGKTTADKKYCVATKCSGVGASVDGGQHCCSKNPGKSKDGKTNICQCLASAKKVPDVGGPHDCCSRRMNKDRTCAFLLKGEYIAFGTKGKEVCLSGSATAAGECRCIAAGSSAEDPNQCCSGAFGHDGKCGCMAVGDYLSNGARQINCCTGTAGFDGFCRCAAAGAPVPKGNASECCAGADASGEHCGCYGPNTSIVSAVSEHCCGGSHRFEHGHCVCIKSGYAVGPWVPEDACCSHHKKGDVCV